MSAWRYPPVLYNDRTLRSIQLQACQYRAPLRTTPEPSALTHHERMDPLDRLHKVRVTSSGPYRGRYFPA